MRPARTLVVEDERALLLVVLLWLGAVNPVLWGADEPLNSAYLARVFDNEHGLPHNSATAIVQTPDGMLWFGTWGGLTRFDGKECLVFTRVEAPSLPSHRIVNVHLDRAGRLWVSTMHGMASVKDGVWTAYGKDSGWVGDYVRAFAESPSGPLYATTFNGKVLRIHADRFEELPSPPGITSRGVYPHIDETGALWLVTPQFVGRLVGGTWQETIPASSWAGETFLGIASSRAGVLWIITNKRVLKYQGGKLVWQASSMLTAGVWQAREDSRGTLWLGTMGSGLYRLAPDGTWSHFTRENGLPSNVVRTVFEDREENLWVGTDGGGLVRLRPRLFHVWDRAQGLPEDAVVSVAADSQGRVFIGMLHEGVVCLEGKTIRRVCPPNSTQPLTGAASALLVDRKGRLWVGGSHILRVLDGPNHQYFGSEQIGNMGVSVLLEDRRGQIWAGSGKGVYRFDGQAFRPCPLPGDPEEGALTLGEGPRDGSLLVSGNLSGALYRLHKGRFAPVPEARAAQGARFFGLLCDPDGTLWLGAERATTLGCWRDGRFTQVAVATTLPGVRAFGPITRDEKGNLWIGCAQGIVRVPRSELAAFLEGHKRELAAQVFTKEDGLPTRDCTRAGTAARDAQGRLWFGTLKGAVRVDPSRFHLNAAPPVLAINKVLRDGVVAASRDLFLTSSPPAALDAVVVPAGTTRLEIHYAGLCLSAPEKVRYQYRIKGVDRDWTDVGNLRVAYLQPLRPGTYTFQVRAANTPGVWTETAATQVLVVEPFYWQTLWFQALVIGGLMGGASLVAWGVTRGRLRRQIERLEQQRLLAREQARLASVLEATSDLVAFLDESGNILYLNPAGRKMAGIAQESGIGDVLVSSLHPAWAAERIFHEGIPAATRAGTWSGETALRHADGHEVPLSQVIAAHKGVDGSVSFLSTIARDVSQRKQTEAQLRGSLREKEALLKEVHHRVKNNLQVICSLLSLQAAQLTDPVASAALSESQNRVLSMALVHEELYQSGDLAHIPLAAHIENLCAYLYQAYGVGPGRVQLHLDVAAVSLDLHRAVPCGLIINELVTNALKHAFPGARPGRVCVGLKAEGPNRYTLAVADDGIGLPPELDIHRASSLGLQLVADLTQQLRGSLAVTRHGGTTFTITFDAGPSGGP
jgi:PAS domain S-box-containing protein